MRTLARVTLSPACGCEEVGGSRGRRAWTGTSAEQLQTAAPAGCPVPPRALDHGSSRPAGGGTSRAGRATSCHPRPRPHPRPRLPQQARTWCSTRARAARQPKRSSEWTCTFKPLGKRRCAARRAGGGAGGWVGWSTALRAMVARPRAATVRRRGGAQQPAPARVALGAAAHLDARLEHRPQQLRLRAVKAAVAGAGPGEGGAGAAKAGRQRVGPRCALRLLCAAGAERRPPDGNQQAPAARPARPAQTPPARPSHQHTRAQRTKTAAARRPARPPTHAPAALTARKTPAARCRRPRWRRWWRGRCRRRGRPGCRLQRGAGAQPWVEATRVGRHARSAGIRQGRPRPPGRHPGGARLPVSSSSSARPRPGPRARKRERQRGGGAAPAPARAAHAPVSKSSLARSRQRMEMIQ